MDTQYSIEQYSMVAKCVGNVIKLFQGLVRLEQSTEHVDLTIACRVELWG